MKKQEKEKSLKKQKDYFNLSSISSSVFDSKSPYKGIWIHTGASEQEIINIEDGFAVNPENQNDTLRFLVDNNTMKAKIIQAKQTEERVTVETWLDLTERVATLENQVNDQLIPDVDISKQNITTIQNNAIFTIDDMNTVDKFWKSKNAKDTIELVIPSNGGIRLKTSYSELSNLSDITLKMSDPKVGKQYGILTCPKIVTANLTDVNYNTDSSVEHVIENTCIQANGRYKYIDRTRSSPTAIDIWSYTAPNTNSLTSLTYPIGDNGKFSKLHIDGTAENGHIYFDKPTSRIKIAKTTTEE